MEDDGWIRWCGNDLRITVGRIPDSGSRSLSFFARPSTQRYARHADSHPPGEGEDDRDGANDFALAPGADQWPPAARAQRPCESGARIGVRDREDLDRRVHDPNGVSDGPGLFALLSGLIPDA